MISEPSIMSIDFIALDCVVKKGEGTPCGSTFLGRARPRDVPSLTAKEKRDDVGLTVSPMLLRRPGNFPDYRCYHRSAAPNENSRLYVFSQTVERRLPGVIKTQPGTAGNRAGALSYGLNPVRLLFRARAEYFRRALS